MVTLAKNQNPAEISKQQIKGQLIRNLNKEAIPGGRNCAEKEHDEIKSRDAIESKTFVSQIFNRRPCHFVKEKFVTAIKTDKKTIPAEQKDRSLSPSTKLRFV